MTFRMTAVPISRQVVDGDAVLVDSQCTCIFQSSCEWYFINFVGKFEIHSGMLFELPLKKTWSSQNTSSRRFFLFLPKYNTYAFSSSINVRYIGSCKENGKRLLPPPMDTSWVGMGPGYYQQTFKNHGYLLPAKFWWNSWCNFGEVAEFVI